MDASNPNSKLYLGKEYKKRRSHKYWEKITRGDLISTGKNERGLIRTGSITTERISF